MENIELITLGNPFASLHVSNKLVLAGAAGLDKSTLGLFNALPLNECHVFANSPVNISHMYDIYTDVN